MGRATIGKTALAVALLCLVVAGAVEAEVIRKGNLQVSYGGRIAPHDLPRVGTAPVSISVSAEIRTIDAAPPPQLRHIVLAINRNGRLDPRGLPVCRLRQLQPASTEEARSACPDGVVGHGLFKAAVDLPEQSPYPSDGTILAFNGRLEGRPVIFAHIYGTKPLPTSFTLPFEVKRRPKGTYGIALVADLPRVAADWGYIRGFSMTLNRRFRYRGETRSYFSAGCPAPSGFPGATFAFANASFGFEDGKQMRTTLTRNCGVRS
jgi:hypothetical protein